MIRVEGKKTFLYVSKTVIIAVICLFCQNSAYSQSISEVELSNNSIYFDMGAGLVSQVSINYERKFYSGEKISWFGRLGIGEAGTIEGNSKSGGGALGAVTMLTGKSNNHFELNAGIFAIEDGGFLLLDIGYRFQKPTKGLVFKAHLGTLGAGVGLGFAF
ncbi:MAG: hypothetical protein ABJH08_10365 [Balneola sp.]